MNMKKIVVHSGGFHADDLFATATTLLYLEKEGYSREQVEIIRTRDKGIIETADFVLDVGGVFDEATFRFDHHQEFGAGERENGIPYASFGLVWHSLGPKLGLSEYVLTYVDERMVQTIDALDNGVDVFGESAALIPHVYILQSAIRALHPTWNEENYSLNDAFFKALEIARTLLDREIRNAVSEEEGREIIRNQYELTRDSMPELLVLDGHYPYGSSVESMPEVRFVVKPSEDGQTWKVRTVRKGRKSFEARTLFPESWAGKRDEELAEITGVPGAVFVHNKRFIAVAKTKEGALELAKKALKQ